MICTYECTFCKDCVDNILHNVCQNCGGGFMQRPVRPKNNLRRDNFLGKDPAGIKVYHFPIDINDHIKFSKELKNIPANKR